MNKQSRSYRMLTMAGVDSQNSFNIENNINRANIQKVFSSATDTRSSEEISFIKPTTSTCTNIMNLDSLPTELTTENVVFFEAYDIQVDEMVENNDLDAIFTSGASISDDLILQAADEKINLLNCIYEQEITFRGLNGISEPDTHQELAIEEINTREPATHEPVTQKPASLGSANIQVPDTLLPDTLVPDTLETETHEYYEYNNQEHGNDNQEPNSHSDFNDQTYEQRESDMETDSSGKEDREEMPRNEGAAEIPLRKRRKRRHKDRATWKKNKNKLNRQSGKECFGKKPGEEMGFQCTERSQSDGSKVQLWGKISLEM